MTRLHDDALETVFFLYPSEVDAESGAKTGGTGFLVRIESVRLDGHYYFAVTNKHVIENGATTARFNRHDGTALIFDSSEQDWIMSKTDDLAICQFSGDDLGDLKFKALGADHFLDKATMQALNIGVGDEAFVSGRIPGVDGHDFNMPIYRFGRLCANDIRFVDGQESLLVEAHSTGGLSGSPVFVGVQNLFIRPGVTAPFESRMWLLGVQWAYVKDVTPVYFNGKASDSQTVEMNSGVMCVVPAWKLWQLLHSPQVSALRDKGDEIGLASGIAPRQ